MLVLPNMAPAHHASRSTSVSRTLLRYVTNTMKKISILLLKIVVMAAAIFFVPRTIHIVVQCFDDLYEMLGRRAKSPFETEMLWGSGALIAMAVLVVLHARLYRLSYNVILDEDMDEDRRRERLHGRPTWKERKVTWERTLARIIIPGLLIGFLMVLGWKIVWTDDVRELITANTVDLEDDTRAGLVWSDR
ncbi:hypothetical protein M3J09_010514 [Ascochyta lentis]